jgi:hypothetical protein
MKLSDAQWEFLKDLACLISFIETKGYKATGGELLRTEYQQAEYVRTGKSKTNNSRHLQKLAIDLAIFDQQGNLLTDNVENKGKLRLFGDFWEAMAPNINIWGGYFPEHYGSTFIDIPHFERKPPE